MPQGLAEPEEARGGQGIEIALNQAQLVLRSVKEQHLFAKSKDAKQQGLARIITETE